MKNYILLNYLLSGKSVSWPLGFLVGCLIGTVVIVASIYLFKFISDKWWDFRIWWKYKRKRK